MNQSAPNLNPNVSVDCALFGFDFEKLNVLLIERGNSSSPSQNKEYQLPGDLIRDDEDLGTAAHRVLNELTGLGDIFLEQFYSFGDPKRVRKEDDVEWLKAVREEPDARVITVGYFALVCQQDYTPQASSFAARAEWVPVKSVPKLHFDHDQILERAKLTLRTRLRLQPVGLELLPEKFSLTQLQTLYESILSTRKGAAGTKLDRRNFRRRFQKMDLLLPTGEMQKGVPHKPAQLFRFDKEKYELLKSEDSGFCFGG